MVKILSQLHVYQLLKQMLNETKIIIIEVKDSGERYVAENKFSSYKFVVVVRKKCTEFA